MRKYSEFKDYIDVDAVVEALGIEETENSNPEDKITGFCPFPENHAHGDTTGKFVIFRESKVTHCYACGSRNLLALVMELLDLDQSDAEAWLRKHALEDARSDPEFVEDFLNSFKEKNRSRPVLPEFGPRILDRFKPIAECMPEYLEERGISEEVAERFNIRYAEEYRVRRVYKNEPQEYRGPSIIFPHYYNERLVGWQARVVNQNPPGGPPSYPGWVPKYKNTSEFPKDFTLYGHDNVKRMRGPIVVTESVPSVLYLVSLGIPAVCTFGAEPTRAQLKMLSGFESIVGAQDNDKAGIRYIAMLSDLENYLGTIAPPTKTQGSDIGDYSKIQDGDKRVLELFNQAEQSSLFNW